MLVLWNILEVKKCQFFLQFQQHSIWVTVKLKVCTAEQCRSKECQFLSIVSAAYHLDLELDGVILCW